MVFFAVLLIKCVLTHSSKACKSNNHGFRFVIYSSNLYQRYKNQQGLQRP